MSYSLSTHPKIPPDRVCPKPDCDGARHASDPNEGCPQCAGPLHPAPYARVPQPA